MVAVEKMLELTYNITGMVRKKKLLVFVGHINKFFKVKFENQFLLGIVKVKVP